MPATVDYTKLENTMDKLKETYMPVVNELCSEHLRTFNKFRYIEQIAAELSDALPELDIQKAESASLCVTNAMNRIAKTLYGQRKSDSVFPNAKCTLCNPVSETVEKYLIHNMTFPVPRMKVLNGASVEWSTFLLDDTLSSTFSPSAGCNL